MVSEEPMNSEMLLHLSEIKTRGAARLDDKHGVCFFLCDMVKKKTLKHETNQNYNHVYCQVGLTLTRNLFWCNWHLEKLRQKGEQLAMLRV